MSGWIDSHCHLNYEGLAEQREAVLARARARGVRGFLTVNTTLSQYDEIAAIAAANDDVWCSVGVHPHSAAGEIDVTEDALVERARRPNTIAIGETGLDYYYDNSPRPEQAQSFRKHIRAARRAGVPVIVHTRDAEADTHAIMAEALEEGPYKAVIHCFSGTPGFARQMLDLGFSISFSGIVTFKKATDVQEAAKLVPADRLLVETDAPFLAPVPNRGKRCEPAFVVDTAEFVARLRGEAPERLADQTSDNFFALFDRARCA
ncbi:MAG: TatD family hydrolase [Rhodothalassiaceae bacterium]